MLRWSEEQLREHRAKRMGVSGSSSAPKPGKAKYGNRKTAIGDDNFDSKAEAARFVELIRLQESGLISGLRRQVSFELAPAVKIQGNSRRSPPLRYFADFVYCRDGKQIIEDVKGQKKVTEGYRIKRHLMAVAGYQIVEVRKSSTRRLNPV